MNRQMSRRRFFGVFFGNGTHAGKFFFALGLALIIAYGLLAGYGAFCFIRNFM